MARRESKRVEKGGAVKAPRTLYILSDSTGNLARHMLTAILTQFPLEAFAVRVKTYLSTEAKLAAALEEVAKEAAIVFHAVVAPAAKEAIARRCEAAGIASCDLTGQFVEFLARESGIEPRADTRLLHDVNESYHRRIAAIEFALQHDDGLGLDTIHEADVVLVGISRTSKTPTTMYLAQQGYFVGNVALAYGLDLPLELLALPEKKVVGLTIEPSQLVEIRTRRQREWKMGDTSYNEMETVDREVAWSRKLFARQGWRTLNVTNQAIEETAARLVELVGLTRQ
jgi:[pyruvate, water dikinase]-phosphate phosphotransferase / [pyruvate, water dikinase] kinase